MNTRIHTHTLTESETRYMHALSLQASQVADIFHFCAYKVIIIILVGVTEQGSIHCNCQPPINILLLRGNPRSSRDLQFTQLRSMWTKRSILSFPLFLPFLFPYPCSSFSYHITTWFATVSLIFLYFSVFVFSYLLSPAFLPHDFLYLSVYLVWPFASTLTWRLQLCSPPLIDIVVTHWAEFSRFFMETAESDEVKLIAGGSNLTKPFITSLCFVVFILTSLYLTPQSISPPTYTQTHTDSHLLK